MIGMVVAVVSKENRQCTVHAAAASRNRETTGSCRSGLPEFTREDVRAHLSPKKGGRVYVTYKCGVYDVTDFIEQHPGGIKRIMLAAGGDIERFWKQFTVHDDDAVRDILERHRIGNIKHYKPISDVAAEASGEAQWAKEPERSPALVPLSKRPFNAETPEGVLDEFFTPNDLFFVRNHMPVPRIDNVDDPASPFCLQVEGEGLVPRCFPLAELKSMFPHRTVVNTIQCGGNRRSEMSAAYEKEGGAVKGLNWSNGGIGTAAWTGVALRDVIQACRAPSASMPPTPGQQHVLLEGVDKDPAGHFNVSVPWDTAMDRNSEALVAFEMNGEPIPRDHGYPLRAIIPGTVGVRNCKWLQRVRVQSCESQSVWQQQDYKNFPPYLTKPDPSLPSVYAMPVQSSVTDVSYDSGADAVVVKGYAYAGGGNGVQRVDVSFDSGKTFETTATMLPVPPGALEKTTPRPRRDTWAWRQVALHHPVERIKAAPQPCLNDASDASCFNVCFKATTDDQATQPPVAAYNFRGLLFNGYSCREVRAA